MKRVEKGLEQANPEFQAALIRKSIFLFWAHCFCLSVYKSEQLFHHAKKGLQIKFKIKCNDVFSTTHQARKNIKTNIP